MNKRELVKWIETKEIAALEAVESATVAAMEKEKDRIIEESGLKDMLLDFLSNNKEWLERFENLVSNDQVLRTMGVYYSSPIRSLLDLSEYSRLPDKIFRNTKSAMGTEDIESLTKIRKAKYEARGKVKDNYFSVKENVKRCATAKEAIEYLRELGFDVPESKPKQKSKALPAMPVDTRFLFVGESDGKDGSQAQEVIEDSQDAGV